MLDLETMDDADLDEIFDDWKKHLAIDKDALDEEWLKQPELMLHFGTLEAEAKRDYDDAWEQAKVVRSRLIKEIKEDNPKMAKDIVEANFRDHDDHKEAKQDMIEAEYRLGRIKIMVWAVNQRKAALEGLVRLYGQEYWSAPHVGDVDAEVGHEIQKEAGRKSTEKKVKESKEKRRRRRKS